MGFISDLFGATDKFKASGVDLQQGATTDQTNQAYAQGQTLNGQQTSVADFLQGRSGNANPLDFSAATGTLGQGNQLLGQLMAQGQGQGPNPALAQLQQTTGQNINNAAGMAASARGINPALAARMAVNGAAGANQTAAGQAAVMTAQQQLAAQGQAAQLVGQQAGQQAGLSQAQAGQQNTNIQQLMSQLASMGGQNLNQQQILQNALGNYNSTNVQQNLGVQQTNAGVAAQNANTNAKIAGGVMSGIGGALGLAEGGQVPARSDKDVARAILEKRGRKLAAGDEAQPARKRTDKDVAREILFGKGGRVPKLAAGGEALGSRDKEIAAQVLMRKYFTGGRVKHYDEGGVASDDAGSGSGGIGSGIRRGAGAFLGNFGQTLAGVAPTNRPTAKGPLPAAAPLPSGPPPLLAMPQGGAPASQPGPSSFMGRLLQGQLLQSPGGSQFARGGATRPVFLSRGAPEIVPGRASVPEGVDSESADKVPAWLSPGEIVIPRSDAQAEDAPERAKDFVAHIVATKGRSGYHRVAKAKRRAEGRR